MVNEAKKCGSFLGTSPMGEQCRLGNGLCENGPAILLAFNSFSSLVWTTLGFAAADRKHSESVATLEPV